MKCQRLCTRKGELAKNLIYGCLLFVFELFEFICFHATLITVTRKLYYVNYRKLRALNIRNSLPYSPGPIGTSRSPPYAQFKPSDWSIARPLFRKPAEFRKSLPRTDNHQALSNRAFVRLVWIGPWTLGLCQTALGRPGRMF